MTSGANRCVVIVEDDRKIARILADAVTMVGYDFEICADAWAGSLAVARLSPCAVLLDRTLPDKDGIELCRDLRQTSDVPILMITARVDEEDRLSGLAAGADDYICKPFSPREAVARLDAVLRRSRRQCEQPRPAPAWVIDDEGLTLSFQGQSLGLTSLEFRVLRALLNNPGRLMSRDRLLDQLHDDTRDISDRAIDSHIKNIRRKIGKLGPDAGCISAVYGEGYRYEAEPKQRSR